LIVRAWYQESFTQILGVTDELGKMHDSRAGRDEMAMRQKQNKSKDRKKKKARDREREKKVQDKQADI